MVLLLGSSTVDPNVGTTFVQNMCYHLRFVKRVRIKGMRDLYEAYLDYMKETGKEWLKNNQNGSYELPIYQSTVDNRKVGFKLVGPEERSKLCIYYNDKNEENGHYLEKYIGHLKITPTFIKTYQLRNTKYFHNILRLLLASFCYNFLFVLQIEWNGVLIIGSLDEKFTC